MGCVVFCFVLFWGFLVAHIQSVEASTVPPTDRLKNQSLCSRFSITHGPILFILMAHGHWHDISHI